MSPVFAASIRSTPYSPPERPDPWDVIDFLDFLPGPPLVRLLLAMTIGVVVWTVGSLLLALARTHSAEKQELEDVAKEVTARPPADLD